jgi:hypothetical protein
LQFTKEEIRVWMAYFRDLEQAKQERDEFLGSSPNMGWLSGWEEVEALLLDHLSQVQRDYCTPKNLKLTNPCDVTVKSFAEIGVRVAYFARLEQAKFRKEKSFWGIFPTWDC